MRARKMFTDGLAMGAHRALVFAALASLASLAVSCERAGEPRIDASLSASALELRIGDRCTSDADCAALGPDARCSLSMPGGYCVIDCFLDPTLCPAGAYCLAGEMCVAACGTNGACLNPDNECQPGSLAPDSTDLCRPTCALACPVGVTCDPSLNLCLCGSADTTCDNRDQDCDGRVDEGCDYGASHCPSGHNLILGTTGPDTLIGTANKDCIVGLEGDDIIEGRAQDDVLLGGPGADVLRAEDGEDTLLGGAGDDWLDGGNGKDLSDGGGGNDIIIATNGKDTAAGGLCHDRIYGGNGSDRLSGDDGADRIVGGRAPDTVFGGDGIDACKGLDCELAENDTECTSDDDCSPLCPDCSPTRCVLATGICTDPLGFEDVTCDGADDDCDGIADDEFQGLPTSCGVGACAATGTTVCDEGTTRDSCRPGSPAASDATCDGIDDDCDGTSDEEYAPAPTTCGVGACTATGMTSCVSGQMTGSCIAAAAPVAYWPAEGNATDVAGGNHGTLLSGVTFAAGKLGQAFSFDGSSEAYIQLPDAASLLPATGQFTIEAWIKPNFGVFNEWDTVLTKRDGCGSEGLSYQLAVNKGDPNDIYGAGVVALSMDSGITRATSGTASVPDDGSFHHIAGTFDGALAKVYLDGVLVGQALHMGPIVATSSAPTIGHHGGECPQRANGLIDEIAFYDRALTTAEIGQHATLCPHPEDSCTPGTPSPDTNCDGIDDDCDGQVDEDYVPLPTTCGVGSCEATGTTSCAAGQEFDSCTPGTPGADDASCDGIDDDCDGTADEAYTPASTTCGAGACAATGATACLEGQTQDSCMPGTPSPGDATCDAVDDDCDGTNDENYVSVGTTTCGRGACAAEGAIVCVDGQEVDTCTPGEPTPDTTCDGVNDDCDEGTDEDFPSVPTTCGGSGQCSAAGQTVCARSKAGLPTIEDTCVAPCEGACADGVDDDRDGRLDCFDGDCIGDSVCMIGGACTSDADCAALGTAAFCDLRFPHGYCSIPCDTSGAAECPLGNLCVQHECVAACDASARCADPELECRALQGVSGFESATGPFCRPICDPGSGHCDSPCPGAQCDDAADFCCAATDETCDGLDDDCDGTVDDDFPSTATICGSGACRAEGTLRCAMGEVVDACDLSCSETACTDGRDDDGDGLTDCDDDECRALPECVRVGDRCTSDAACAGLGAGAGCGLGFPGGYCLLGCRDNPSVCPAGSFCFQNSACVAACDGNHECTHPDHRCQTLRTEPPTEFCRPTCALTCPAGRFCDPSDNFCDRCLTTDVRCDGADEDCDGLLDEDFAPAPTTCGVGACASTGTAEACLNGVPDDTCVPGTPAASDDTCDAIDDDCDGVADDDFVPEPTNCDVGTCEARGTTFCEGGVTGDTCVPAAGGCEGDCADGLDEDFDGFIDCQDTDCFQDPACIIGDSCTTDEHCAALGDGAFCDPVLAGYCTLPCANAHESGPGCPAGLYCHHGKCIQSCSGTQQCPNDDQECAHPPDFEGRGLCFARCAERPCLDGWRCETASGECVPLCTPTDGTCDGIDDDNDGAIDEGYASVATSCGVGACAAMGARACVFTEGGSQEVDSCTPRQPIPDTTCDGVDQNCDGVGDDGYAAPVTTCGVGACTSYGLLMCSSGALVDTCTPGLPALGDASCNGVDDDCDGRIDENFVSQTIVCGEGSCTRIGLTSCNAGIVSSSCVPGTPASSDPTCDGIDDDCDGRADEGFVATPTNCGSGACSASGAIECMDGVVTDACAPRAPSPDTTCDGIDDDCDEVVDEAFEPPCQDAVLSLCSTGRLGPLGPFPPGQLLTQRCDDGDVCSGVEGCDSGQCQPGTSLVIGDDGLACTLDTCDPVRGEIHPLDLLGAACEDGDRCNGRGMCACADSGPNLLRNPSFESVPALAFGPNLLPSEWTAFVGMPDTVSENGTYGLPARFPAADGRRYLVLDDQETGPSGIRQTLSTPLLAGNSYRYAQVSLGGRYLLTLGATELATVGANASRSDWDTDTICFVAPETGSSFGVRAMSGESIDQVALVRVPSCDCTPDSCGAGDPAPVTDDANPCTVDTCDPLRGVLHAPAALGTSCDDDDPCTARDECNGTGRCAGTPTGAPGCVSVGSHCDADADCASLGTSAFCLRELTSGWPGGACSIRCVSVPCPTGSICVDGVEAGFYTVNDSSTGNICLPTCQTDADCQRETARCTSTVGGPTLGHFCHEGCRMDADCSSGYYCSCAHPPCEISASGGPSHDGPFCRASTPTESNCADGFDNDVDSLRDCADPDCAGSAACGEDCFNNLDDDGDGKQDCLDSECDLVCEVCESRFPPRDEDRDGLSECDDPDCRSLELCLERGSLECFNGQDDDRDGTADCSDPDCRGAEDPYTFETCIENVGDNCFDGKDNDADALVDCDDPECVGSCPGCDPGCGAENTDFKCADGRDNDHDGGIDCADIDCQVVSICLEDNAASCADGRDNDLDGLVDCADPNCGLLGACREDTLTACTDGRDNDFDATIDCSDAGCRGIGPCAENSDARCHDGIDNDGDGVTDCADSDCALDFATGRGVRSCTEAANVNCDDHLDNDGDGVTDCADSGCNCFERCDDGIDNDGNGAIDCADWAHCAHDPACVEDCGDGIDNNRDHLVDCFDHVRCDGDPACVEANCMDGIDNEPDGRIDCRDRDCTDDPACPEDCENGIDDDANGRIDCGDSECVPLFRCSEAVHCDDGIDNDRDFRADCADNDCAEDSACDEAKHCRDGVDNDRDAYLDCSDPDCAGRAPCISEMCGNMVDDDGDRLFDCADFDCEGAPVCNIVPPHPRDVAPPNDPSAPTTLFDSWAFVYGGPSPIQWFMDPTTLNPRRAALLRGNVRGRDDAPLAGVRVTVLDHAEFGESRTTTDGSFTMVVNGGTQLVVRYELSGFVAVQRAVDVGWADYATAPDVVMTPYDTAVTVVDLSGTAGMQVARGNVATDGRGTRQATILLPEGVGATMVMPDGSTVPMSAASIRLTELTVGANGFDAMPAHLPANTAYGYAVDMTADEALAANAARVDFSEPLILYVQNYLDFHVGAGVPSGFYDRERGVWIAADNGRVVQILDTTAGVAALDVTGDGVADGGTGDFDGLGITQEELGRLAALYEPGQTLWRVPIRHFSIYDFNLAFGFPDDALRPPVNGPYAPQGGSSSGGGQRRVPGNDGTRKNCQDQVFGSIVNCYSQSLSEEVPIAGTPYALQYDSLRVSPQVGGAGPAQPSSSFTVQVTGPDVPESLREIELTVQIAGRTLTQTFEKTANQTYKFEFDGFDAAGRPVTGAQQAQAKLCFEYPIVSMEGLQGINGFGNGRTLAGFEFPSCNSVGGHLCTSDDPAGRWCESWTQVVVIAPSVGGPGGGGGNAWGLDVHHVYDPLLQQVYHARGQRQGLREPAAEGASSGFAGNGKSCSTCFPCVNFGCGCNLFADCGSSDSPNSDGLEVFRVTRPEDLEVGPDGTLYVLEAAFSDPAVNVLSPDGSSRHVIGSFATTLGGAGFVTPASRYSIRGDARDIELGPDGSVYLQGTSACGYILRFSADGSTIERVAGSDTLDCSTLSADEGASAVSARLGYARGFELGPDGANYVAEPYRVRRIGSDGRIWTAAGTSTLDPDADPDAFPLDVFGAGDTTPVLATDMAFGNSIRDIAVTKGGELYIATTETVFVVGVDGFIRLFAGGARTAPSPNPDPFDPIHAQLVIDRIEIGTDGSLFILDKEGPAAVGAPAKMYRVLNGTLVPVAAGSNEDYVEGMPSSRVLREPLSITVHPEGRVLVGDAGRFRVVSPAPRTTLIEHAGPGIPSALVGRGHRIPSSDGSVLWEFSAGGRHQRTLNAFTGEVVHQFGYDEAGFLASVRDGDGNETRIERDVFGRPAAIVAPFGPRTTLVPNTESLLAAVIGPDGATHSFTYRPDTALLATMTDPESHTSTFTFDGAGRLTRDEDAATGFHALEHTEAFQGFEVTRHTADTVNPTIYRESQSVYGSLRREVERPDGTKTITESGSDGTEVRHFADGTEVTTVKGPDPRFGFGMNVPVPERVSVKVPSGLELVTTETRTGVTDPFEPTRMLQLVSERRVGTDLAWVSTYDGPSRRWHTRSPAGRESEVQLDAQGRVIGTEVTGLSPVVMGYDAQGRLKSMSVLGPGGLFGSDARTTTFTYRAQDGYLGTVSAPIPFHVSTLTPDPAGRVTDIERPDGEHVGLQYSGRGETRFVTPPGRAAHEMRYTAVGLLGDYEAPAATAGGDPALTNHIYDRDRRVDFVTLPGVRTVDPVYDPLTGRLDHVTTATTGAEYSYAYHPTSGRVSSVTKTEAAGAHVLGFTYDGVLPTVETWSGDAGLTAGSVTRVYDDHFRVDKLKVNGQEVVDYGFDLDGLVTSTGPGALTITRRTDNGIIASTTLGQVTTAQPVTAFGELDRLTAGYGASVYFDEDITERDKLGRIVARSETVSAGAGPTATTEYVYGYDLAGRLTSVFKDGSLVPTDVYTHDANGNRLSHAAGPGTVVGRYDGQDRLTRYCPEDASGDPAPALGLPCFEYGYAEAGDLQTKTDLTAGGAVTGYEYDEFGGLLQVTLPDGRVIDYELDASGRRVGKRVDGVKQWGLLYQGALAPIAELDANNNVVSTFVYATRGHVPDYMVRGGEVYRFVTDHLGSVRLVVKVSDGTVAQRLDYDEFGNVTVDTAPGFQPFGFAGGLYDGDTGLVRFGARDYDPVVGRWTAKDPILFAGGDTNLYSYVFNDPINFVDPSGTLTFQIGGGITGGAQIGGSIQVAFVFDLHGNIGLAVTGGLGQAVGWSGGATFGGTNAETIYDLQGRGRARGGALGPFGLEKLEGLDPCNKVTYTGWSGSFGTGTPIEWHQLAEYTKLLLEGDVARVTTPPDLGGQ